MADGVASADFDLDGFVDLALTNGQGVWPFNVGPTQIFRNVSKDAGNTNHWIEIDLRGVQSNQSAGVTPSFGRVSEPFGKRLTSSPLAPALIELKTS